MSQDHYAMVMMYYHCIVTLALARMMMVAVALFAQLVDWVHLAVEVTVRPVTL